MSIKYIAFFDRVARRYCSDLIPVDDDTGAIKLRLAKRFTFSKYCTFVKPCEIECREIGIWDSEEKGFIPEKHPENTAFTLDQVDFIYANLAKQLKVEGVDKVQVNQLEVQTGIQYGDFRRDLDKKEKEIVNDEKQI